MAAANDTSTFEQAVDAIVIGDEGALRALLAADPTLVHARSGREHRSTLLHYVAANGVEGERQRTPKNIVAITRMLLAAGADVNAEADMYGGGSTTLGLAATSVHPEQAGVQLELLDVLLAAGARLDRPGAGNGHGLVYGCLANGQPEAARHLAARGAPLDLVGAAGIGEIATVRKLLAGSRPDDDTLGNAFGYAAGYGQSEPVAVLLDAGVRVDHPLRIQGTGHTALHIAAYHAHVEVVRLLLERGADRDARDATWGTTPAAWRAEGERRGTGTPERHALIEALLARRSA